MLQKQFKNEILLKCTAFALFLRFNLDEGNLSTLCHAGKTGCCLLGLLSSGAGLVISRV